MQNKYNFLYELLMRFSLFDNICNVNDPIRHQLSNYLFKTFGHKLRHKQTLNKSPEVCQRLLLDLCLRCGLSLDIK